MNIKQPALHIVLLLLVLSLVGIMFYRTEKSFVEINKLQIEVGRQEENIAKLAELSTTLPTLSSELSTYMKTLPSSETDVADFALLVEQNAKSLGLVISNHFEDFPRPIDVLGKNITGLGMEITVDGTYQGLTSFFARISALPYFFKIDKITILKHETKTGIKAIINGSLMMNIEKK